MIFANAIVHQKVMKDKEVQCVRMKTRWLLVVVLGCSYLLARADVSGLPPPYVDQDDLSTLGISQGEFALRIIRKAGGGRFFDRTITAARAANMLTDLGFAPEQGWRTAEDLTWWHIETAYRRLLATIGEAETKRLPDVAVFQTLNTAAPAQGDTVRIDLLAWNRGLRPANRIRLAVKPSEGLKLVGTEADDFKDSVWEIRTLEAGTRIRHTVSAEVTAPAGARLTSRLELISMDQEEDRKDNNQCTAGLIVRGPGVSVADLEVKVVTANLITAPKDEVVYYIGVTNHGPDTAFGVQVLAPLPRELTFKKASSPAYSNSVWTVGTLAPGSAAVLSIVTQVAEATNDWSIITNAVFISRSDVPDPDPANDTGSAKITVRLLEWLSDAIEKALILTTTERQPISPTRPLWR